jgi:ketosteroid isomerase-like protein
MSEESTTPDLANRWRESADAHARRDFDAMISFFAPDAVWDASSAGIGSFEGAASIRRFVEDWIGAYEEYEYNQEEGQDLGNGVSFAVASVGGRLAGSAARVQELWGFMVTWANGMIASVIVRPDIDEARAAAERLAEERGKAVSENLALVRSICAATGRGDYLGAAAFVHPDIEFTAVGGPEVVEARGFVALADLWRGFLDSWENFRVSADNYRQLDDNRFLVLFRRSGRGKVSGLDIAQLAGAEGADVLHLHDGKVIKWLSYWERDRALADLGLKD